MPDKRKMPQKRKIKRSLPRSKTTVIREGESSMTSAPGAKPTVTGRTYVQKKASPVRPPKLGRAARAVVDLKEQTSNSKKAIARGKAQIKTMKAGGYKANPKDRKERLYRKPN